MRTALGRLLVLTAFLCLGGALRAQPVDDRPNILIAIADDWGWPHAGAYGDAVVETPSFDRIAREGVLFEHAYVSSPSCTPSRSALLTGQYHWRLGAGANLWCVFPDDHASYVELLVEAGYEAGHSGKAWGPGRHEDPSRQIAGPRFESFEAFLGQRDESRPFVFWLGTSDPHRPYRAGSGVESGMRLEGVHLFPASPDNDIARSDVADYYFEVQRFDGLVGEALASLERRLELERTLVVMTGDHGMPFPRSKGNLYDSGVRVPLAVRLPAVVSPGRTVSDMTSLTDLAPTFLELTSVGVPEEMTGRSLAGVLSVAEGGRTRFDRGEVFFGKERHVPAQEAPDRGGYPCRAVRTHEYLYIRNFRPDRWPAGTPDYEGATIPGAWYADCDDGPTKRYIIGHAGDDAAHARAYELAFGKRPAEELYDLRSDRGQVRNLAANPAYTTVVSEMAARLDAELRRTGDPRAMGGGDGAFDHHEYLGGGGGKHPDWRPGR